MNAYELADGLELASSDMEYNYHVSDWKLLYESAIVMRKQADRIAELEKEIQNLHMDEVVRIGQEISKEPLSDQALFNIYAYTQDTYTGDNFPVAVGRAVIEAHDKR